MVDFLGRFKDYFIAQSIRGNEEKYRRASILVWVCIGVSALCGLITITDVLVGNVQYLFHLGLFTLFLLSILVLLKNGVNTSLLGNLMMAVSFAFTVYLMYISGGLVSPLIIYLVIIPAFVALIAEPKWVVMWIVLCAGAVSVFFYLHQVGHCETEIHDSGYYLTNSIANYISAIIFIAVLFLYSESARRSAQHQLKAANLRSENLLLNVLPEQTANELKENGTSPARKYESATVLFTDFKGFTAASATMDPEDLLNMLNEYFMHFDRIIDKHGIEKIKTIGDAYMAVGGVPTPDSDHAKNVISAALDIRDWVAKQTSSNKQVPFEIRIGVHSGPVAAGIVGIKKFQYDIWGDTVNTASRMESSGQVGKVNISEATHKFLEHQTDLAFESRGKVEAKGKGEIEMYFVERA